MITVALPKGRTLQATLDRFARAGLSPEEDFAATRKLIVPARGAQARFVLLKDPDVPLYVERGAADLGVCGLDHVLESGADLLVPLDLGFGACRLCLAAPRDSAVARGWRSGDSGAEKGRSLRVATKYPRLTRAFSTNTTLWKREITGGHLPRVQVTGYCDDSGQATRCQGE